MLNRVGKVEDIAEMVYTVARGSFINSIIINVDGGLGAGCNRNEYANSFNMKTLLLTVFLSSMSLILIAQNLNKMEKNKQDSLAITEVLENRYFKGIYDGDTALLGTVYHGGTLLFGDVKGQPYAKTLEQYLDGVKNRQSPKESGKPFKGEILSIRIVNSIAIAEVRVKMYDFVYHEFLSFHKINGQWFLVNKMISDTADQPVIENSLKHKSEGL